MRMDETVSFKVERDKNIKAREILKQVYKSLQGNFSRRNFRAGISCFEGKGLQSGESDCRIYYVRRSNIYYKS